MSKILRDMTCRIGSSCPRIEREVEGSWDIVGTHIPDPTLPPHERKIRVPDRVLPELTSGHRGLRRLARAEPPGTR